MPEFILASRSPRRKQLLNLLVDRFVVKPPEVDEKRKRGEDPESYVLRMAEAKAKDVGEQIDRIPGRNLVVVAADTIVVDDGEILGKPEDERVARQFLERLKGRTHHVLSSIGVYKLVEDEMSLDVISTEVSMREYTDQEIDEYIASGDPLDKAGAYAIQNDSFNPVPAFRGCFANVMGLPLCRLADILGAMDLTRKPEIQIKCQQNLEYDCPVFRDYLPRQGGVRD